MFGWGVKTITTEELADKIKAGKVVLIDVREPSEFAGGRVPGAVNIPLGQLRDRASKLDATAETFLICASGNRSLRAATSLAAAGIDAVSVAGGTSAWQSAGRPIVVGAKVA